MLIAKIIVLIALVSSINGISLLVSSSKQKCMVAYSMFGQQQFMIDMKFYRFPGQSKQQGYRINITNTQDKSSKIFDVEQGIFRKEINLPLGVIFNVCIKIMQDRFGGPQVKNYIQYNSRLKKHNSLEKSKVVIPSNLLLTQDLQKSYTQLIQIQNIFPYVKKIAAQTKEEEDQLFQEQKEEIKKIQWLSFIQIGAICIFGGSQFFKLRAIIDNRHNN